MMMIVAVAVVVIIIVWNDWIRVIKAAII